jgi:tripartite-type tricarboxylate transporter receptor subunit TctC
MSKVLTAAAIALAALLSASCAPKEKPYPNRPVHIVVGFAVGGPDTTARLLATQLGIQTGQRFLVDNKPGASGMIGSEFVAKAPADGYTLLMAPASLTSLPSLKKDMPFDVQKDLIPVSQIGRTEASFLVVSTKLPVKTLKEFIDYTKNPANHVAYASTGIGTGSHLRMAVFSKANGAPMLHVPYKSPGEAAVSVMGGETQALFLTASQALPYIKGGKVRALAYDYATRAAFMPDVPTMSEAGAAPTDLDSGFNGLFVPKGTPEAVVRYLEAEVRKAVATPDMQKRLTALGLEPVGGTSDEFRQVVAKSMSDMARAAKAADITPQ